MSMVSELSRQHLMAALSRMAMVVPGRTPKDVLMSVLLEFGDGYLTMSGSDVSKSMSIKIPCESPVMMKSLTNFASMKTMISRFTGKDISIGLEKQTILLSDGQSKFKIPTQTNISEFPKPSWHSDEDVQHTISIEAEELINRISNVIHASNTKSGVSVASSVCLIDSMHYLRIVCFDGNRLSYSDFPQVKLHESEVVALIPVEAARSLIEIFRGVEGTIRLCITESSVYFYSETINFHCRQNEGRLPRLTNLLKDISETQLHLVGGLQLHNLAKQASCVCEEESFAVDLVGANGNLSLYIKTAKGEFRAEVLCDASFEMPISVWFLIDALSKCNQESEVSIGYTAAQRLVIKKFVDGVEVIDLIQGMR